jgi:transcriptional regulator with XRE-family HTH domain
MSISVTIGASLRRRRQAAGMSLADLAGAAGIGKTTLHALELGEGNPTLSTLWALASALGVPLGDLIEEQAAAPVSVVRADEGARVDGAAVHARLLHRLDAPGRVEVYDLGIGHARQDSAAHRPGVQECRVVTRGRVRCGPAAGPVDLTAGDSVRHDAGQPHLYQGLAGRNRALLLMIYP